MAPIDKPVFYFALLARLPGWHAWFLHGRICHDAVQTFYHFMPQGSKNT